MTDPQIDAEAHLQRAKDLLRAGKLAEGWEEYAFRWRTDRWRKLERAYPQPLWDGSPLKGKTILLWGEQGLGEEILNASMIGEILESGATCVLECWDRLVPVFSRSFPSVEVVPRTIPPAKRLFEGDMDYQIPLTGLGSRLRKSMADFNGGAPYLKADQGKVDTFRKRYESSKAPLVVGISWRGARADLGDVKSACLEHWDPVLTAHGVTFVDLQYGDTKDELRGVSDRLDVKIISDPDIDPLREMESFMAQVAAMDLVISTSNTTVHAAGALGIPVWTLLPKDKGLMWYWFEEGETSPWYASQKMFRQQTEGDWGDVLSRVGAALKGLVHGR